MSWIKKIPWLSLTILLLTYGTFGWIYGSWGIELIEQTTWLGELEDHIANSIIYGIGIVAVLFIALIFTAPISLITLGVDNWLKSDSRAFLSIFLGAFAFAVIVQRVDYFARFLILISAALLVKLDLQLAGCKTWLSFFILTIFCLLGFIGGILAFYLTLSPLIAGAI